MHPTYYGWFVQFRLPFMPNLRLHMNTNLRMAAIALVAISENSGATQSCLPPPVQTQAHAICFAREFLREQSYAWPLTFRAEPIPEGWLVHYEPSSSNVRGGAGAVVIARATGDVKRLEGER